MKTVHTKNAPQAIGPYSQAVESKGFIFTSGQIAMNPTGGELPKDINAQTHRALDNLKAILEAAGSNLGKVLKVTIFLKNMDDFTAVNDVYVTYFSEAFPARSCVEVARLPKNALIEIEAIALQ